VKDAAIVFIISLACVVALAIPFTVIYRTYQDDTRVELEEQITEQKRVAACEAVEQEPVRVLCITGVSK
jgi:capsular polysaccharide biosynthesis protein